MTDEEWEDLEVKWADLIRVRGAAEAARRMMHAKKGALEKALTSLERARKKGERARAELLAACEVAEELTQFEVTVCDRSGMMR
jgi:hypothetical protein